MFKNRMTVLVICVVTLLSACGGGGDSGSSAPVATYGSIYTNRTNGGAGIAANYSSQAAANEAAAAYCVTGSRDTNCQLSIEFGQNMCGALYRSLNTATSGKFGSASSSTALVAEANAFTACKNNGGTNCLFGFSACNSGGTSSKQSIIAINGEPNDANSIGTQSNAELSPGWTTEEPK